MDTFVNMFSGAMTTPGAVPESDLPEMIACTTKTFTSLANTLGKPVPDTQDSSTEKTTSSIDEMKAVIAWTFNIISNGKPVCSEKEWDAALGK